MMSHFSIDIINAITRQPLPKTTIGDKTYVAVENGKEFFIRVSVDDDYLMKHRKLYPQGVLNGSVEVEGNFLDHSLSFTSVNSLLWERTGDKALVFTKPPMAWFNDVEDKKKADLEAAKINAKLGLIVAKFQQVELTGVIVTNNGAAIEQAQGAKKKAGGSDMPTVGISAGRYVGLKSATMRQLKWLQSFGSLQVCCKTAKAIKMMKAAHDGVPLEDEDDEEEDEGVPAAAAAAAAAPAPKKRQMIAIDLTKDDSDSDDEEYLRQMAVNKRIKAEDSQLLANG